MPRQFGWSSPHPGLCLLVQLPGGQPCRSVDLVAMRKVVSDKRLSPKKTPPDLDGVEPRRSPRDESVLYSRGLFEPHPYQALSWIFGLLAIR